MARIIVDPPPTGHDVLASDFLKALTVLLLISMCLSTNRRPRWLRISLCSEFVVKLSGPEFRKSV